LFQLAVKRLATDPKGASSVRLVSLGVVESGLDGLAFDLFHRRRNRDLKGSCTTLAKSLGPLNLDLIARLQSDLADSFG
jgi:hypothetical protein